MHPTFFISPKEKYTVPCWGGGVFFCKTIGYYIASFVVVSLLTSSY